MSSGEYGCDPGTKTIYKGISSIKDMGKDVGDYFYSLKDEKFNSFLDLLKTVDNRIVNDKSMQILIKIDFFQEFGDINYLLKVYDLYKKLYGRKQINKDSIEKLGIPEYIIRQYSTETDKQFRNIDSDKLLDSMIKNFDEFECSDLIRLQYQIELLGYTDIVIPSEERKYVVTSIDSNKARTKYVINLYEVSSGKTRVLNMWGSSFRRKQFEVGDILYIFEIKKDFKRERSDEIDPKTKKYIWKPVKNQYEYWLNSYDIL
jgi:DNA polymerase III alpha subunit